MNKTELGALGEISTGARRELLEAFGKQGRPESVPAIAAMLVFPDMCEIAMSKLGERATRYPSVVARYVAFALARSDDKTSLMYRLGIDVLRKIPTSARNTALAAIARTSNDGSFTGKDGFDWPGFVRKLKREVARP